MTNAIRMRKNGWLGLIALLAIGLFVVVISCEEDDAVPVYPQPVNYELVDYLGIYRVAEDDCHNWYGEYDITISKETTERAQETAMIYNFGNQKDALKAFFHNGKLEIPRQRRFMRGVVTDVEGYVSQRKDGVGFVIYTMFEDYYGPQTENCEINAVRYVPINTTFGERELPYEPVTVGKEYIVEK